MHKFDHIYFVDGPIDCINTVEFVHYTPCIAASLQRQTGFKGVLRRALGSPNC